jgi:hypothetical protein
MNILEQDGNIAKMSELRFTRQLVSYLFEAVVHSFLAVHLDFNSYE